MACRKGTRRAVPTGAVGSSCTHCLYGVPDLITAPQPALTVAVGEVEVSLSTGITVLPSVIGFAVTAAGEVLTGTISEVRLTVTPCREGQASSGCH